MRFREMKGSHAKNKKVTYVQRENLYDICSFHGNLTFVIINQEIFAWNLLSLSWIIYKCVFPCSMPHVTRCAFWNGPSNCALASPNDLWNGPCGTSVTCCDVPASATWTGPWYGPDVPSSRNGPSNGRVVPF